MDALGKPVVQRHGAFSFKLVKWAAASSGLPTIFFMTLWKHLNSFIVQPCVFVSLSSLDCKVEEGKKHLKSWYMTGTQCLFMEALIWAQKEKKPSLEIQCPFYLHLGKDSYSLPCNTCNMELFILWHSLKGRQCYAEGWCCVGLNPRHSLLLAVNLASES